LKAHHEDLTRPAYTLLELLMVVAVLSVLATASWRVITNDLHRSRLNAVGFDFASWVESIRKAALNTEGGCEISVANLSEAADGTQLASVRNLNANAPPARRTAPRFCSRPPPRMNCSPVKPLPP